jgi:proteic killer suppression protein
MIKSFKHRGLERYFPRGTRARMQAQQEQRIRMILARLHSSNSPQGMNLPGLHIYQLKGEHRGIWSVRVSGYWRITFGFEGADAIDVNLEDYH